MPSTIVMPTLAFVVVFGVMFLMIVHLAVRILKIEARMSISDKVFELYPIVLKKMPKESEFHEKMVKKEEVQIGELN